MCMLLGWVVIKHQILCHDVVDGDDVGADADDQGPNV